MPRPRISIATVMMLVVTAATASGLAARMLSSGLAPALAGAVPGARSSDIVAVLIAAVVLTALMLATRKRHTANQTMLQIAATCLGLLYLLSLPDITSKRLQLYWLQVLFAVLVVGPLLARRAVRTRMDRGPRRSWWMGTFEAIAFAYLNMLLVGIGGAVEGFGMILLR